MSNALEKALRELDQATDALLGADDSDVVTVCSALERRADAITKIAFLVEEPGGHTPDTLQRLNEALSRGDQATRRILHMRQDAIEEWGRLNQLRRGVSETREPAINYSA